jgi:hypothetical protein
VVVARAPAVTAELMLVPATVARAYVRIVIVRMRYNTHAILRHHLDVRNEFEIGSSMDLRDVRPCHLRNGPFTLGYNDVSP